MTFKCVSKVKPIISSYDRSYHFMIDHPIISLEIKQLLYESLSCKMFCFWDVCHTLIDSPYIHYPMHKSIEIQFPKMNSLWDILHFMSKYVNFVNTFQRVFNQKKFYCLHYMYRMSREIYAIQHDIISIE